jgi:putative ABC transport system permease protein
MSVFSLLWANLFRKRTRTVLTLISVSIAFMLFMLLQSISAAFSSGVTLVGVDRLISSGKYGIIEMLPMNQKQQILAVKGVDLVTHQLWFGGVYQDPRNFFPKFPINPLEYFEMYSELIIAPEQLQKFAQTRTAAVAEAGLAEQYGWKIGDVIPIQADIWPKADGDRSWAFELVGTFTSEESRNPVLLFQYDYFNEATGDIYPGGGDVVGWWTIRVNEPERAAEIANEIDSLFENSQNPTRTSTEDEFSRQFAEQLGDIGFIATIIMSAVFFTMILLTGNTMSQALRERIPELAVLKTIGFTDTGVSALVLGEAIVLCFVGGLVGIVMAYGALSVVGPLLSTFVGSFDFTSATLALAVALSLLLGIVIGILPAMSAKRLTIVDALRRQ